MMNNILWKQLNYSSLLFEPKHHSLLRPFAHQNIHSYSKSQI